MCKTKLVLWAKTKLVLWASLNLVLICDGIQKLFCRFLLTAGPDGSESPIIVIKCSGITQLKLLFYDDDDDDEVILFCFKANKGAGQGKRLKMFTHIQVHAHTNTHMPLQSAAALIIIKLTGGQWGCWPLIKTNWSLTPVTGNQRHKTLRCKGTDVLRHNPTGPCTHTHRKCLCMNDSFILAQVSACPNFPL